jgi:hypothetical protein
LYDRRANPSDAMTLVNKEHKNSVVNVVWQKGSAQELVSGSKSGEIKVWDIRTNWSKVSIPDNNLAQMAAMDVHQHTNVIARLVIRNTFLSMFCYHQDGYSKIILVQLSLFPIVPIPTRPSNCIILVDFISQRQNTTLVSLVGVLKSRVWR